MVPIPEGRAKFENHLKLVYAGRFSEEQKQISEVARAFCRVAERINGLDGVLLGAGVDQGNVESILKNEFKNTPVHIGGVIPNSNIQDEYLKHNIFVLLSDYEGLPIALLEAMACGLVPVCLSIRSGIPQVVINGKTGFLVNDRHDDFLEALMRLNNDKILWDELSKNSKKLIRDNYSGDVIIQQWIKLFNGLTQNKMLKNEYIHSKKI